MKNHAVIVNHKKVHNFNFNANLCWSEVLLEPLDELQPFPDICLQIQINEHEKNKFSERSMEPTNRRGRRTDWVMRKFCFQKVLRGAIDAQQISDFCPQMQINEHAKIVQAATSDPRSRNK